MDKAAALYKQQMEEVLRRFHAIDLVLGASKAKLLDRRFDDEFMWLQIRKIVELVVFGGIVADEARYAALRAEALDNPDYTKDSKVGHILKRLAKITPHHLPIPLGEAARAANGMLDFRETGGEERTVERFIQIFDLAGYYLHVHNPFSEEKAAEFEAAVASSRGRLQTELAYLKSALWHHAKVGLEFDSAVDKPQEGANPQTAWLVRLDWPRRKEVTIVVAEAIDAPPDDA